MILRISGAMPELYPHFFTPKVLRLTAQGSRASASYPGSPGSEYLLPGRPKGLRPYEGCLRPQIIWAQPLRGRRCSALEPRVARKASQPWAVRRNAFGIKKDLSKAQPNALGWQTAGALPLNKYSESVKPHPSWPTRDSRLRYAKSDFSE